MKMTSDLFVYLINFYDYNDIENRRGSRIFFLLRVGGGAKMKTIFKIFEFYVVHMYTTM